MRWYSCAGGDFQLDKSGEGRLQNEGDGMGRIPVEIKQFLRQVNNHYRLERAILFGSRARGDYLKDSDYDVILVSRDFAGIPFTDRVSLMYKYWAREEPIEPLCYTPEELNEKASKIGIVRVALREGIELDVP